MNQIEDFHINLQKNYKSPINVRVRNEEGDCKSLIVAHGLNFSMTGFAKFYCFDQSKFIKRKKFDDKFVKNKMEDKKELRKHAKLLVNKGKNEFLKGKTNEIKIVVLSIKFCFSF